MLLRRRRRKRKGETECIGSWIDEHYLLQLWIAKAKLVCIYSGFLLSKLYLSGFL